jgi:hypothetical protein
MVLRLHFAHTFAADGVSMSPLVINVLKTKFTFLFWKLLKQANCSYDVHRKPLIIQPFSVRTAKKTTLHHYKDQLVNAV